VGHARQALERVAVQRLDVEPTRKRALVRVRGVVHRRRQRRDDLVDDVRIEQRTVGRDPHDDLRAAGPRRQQEPREHVVGRPAHHRGLGARRDLDQRVVGRPVGDRHRDLVEGRATPQAFEHARQHRGAAQVSQDLARQPRGAEPSLHDRQAAAHGFSKRWTVQSS
jgi:hypothetical protein